LVTVLKVKVDRMEVEVPQDATVLRACEPTRNGMRGIGRLAALGLLALTLPAAAEAKAGDSAWAKCVWSEVPGSAAKWLSMPLPTWDTPYADANLLLGHFLLAHCDESAANPLKPNRAPNWKAVAAALKQARPTAPPVPRPSPVQVLLCQSTLTPTNAPPYVYLFDVVRRSGGQDRISFQQYFGNVGGKPVKMPQDLRMVPGVDARVERSCRAIGPEGGLADAG
jgi:hypothetical protein